MYTPPGTPRSRSLVRFTMRVSLPHFGQAVDFVVSMSEHRRAELGYWLGVPYWGKGYATEASQEILRFGFETLKLRRIYASYVTENPTSGRVLEKIGMRYEGILRSHICKWDVFHDLVFYGILHDEFRARSS